MEFKFLSLDDSEGKQVKMFVNSPSSAWVGSNAFIVEGKKATPNKVPSGKYNFNDGRRMTVEGGKITKLETPLEFAANSYKELHEKFDALTGVVLELVEALQKR
mgnify:FL=1|tara:strand:+ start:93 stop:404 length:312 start_codon:yes stop_codon:yes gene_type:complete